MIFSFLHSGPTLQAELQAALNAAGVRHAKFSAARATEPEVMGPKRKKKEVAKDEGCTPCLHLQSIFPNAPCMEYYQDLPPHG